MAHISIVPPAFAVRHFAQALRPSAAAFASVFVAVASSAMASGGREIDRWASISRASAAILSHRAMMFSA